MKVEFRNACLSAAAVSVLYGSGAVQARDLIWDPNQTKAVTGSDSTGNWDTTSPIWVDTALPGTNTTFSSLTPDSVTFGTSITAVNTPAPAPLNIYLAQDITVQNLTLATNGANASYNIFDQGDGGQTLTLGGNVVKTSAGGNPQIFLTNAINLLGGNHTITVKDTGGDDAPELEFTKFNPNSNALTGTGSITIDTTANGAGYDQYGTVAFTSNNDYSGGTNIVAGRLVTTRSNSLGGGLVTISNAGELAFSGAGRSSSVDLTLSNDFNITRSDYTSGNAVNKYQDAILANNDGSNNKITFNGSITVNSTDARITTNTNRMIIANPLVAGATGANSVLDLSGDFSGYVELNADNTAYGTTAGGAIMIRGGVEVVVGTEANLGGANSKLILAGGSIRPTGTLGLTGSAFMTNFGNHNLTSGATATPINTGVDLDSTQTFNVNNLTGNAIGLRAVSPTNAGTLNFTGTNTFTGVPFFDAGTVNVTGTTSFGGFAIRSAQFNVAAGSTVNTTNAVNSSVIVGSNSPDAGTLNIPAGATLNDLGGLTISNDTGTNGTVNQAGTLSVGVETWVGNNNSLGIVAGVPNGGATFTQTAGSTTAKNWFVVGRYFGKAAGSLATGGVGTADFSGGTFNKINGGTNVSVAENGTSVGLLKIRGNTGFTITAGDLYIGHNNTANGTLLLQDTATLTTNGQFDIGIGDAAVGTLTQSAGTTLISNKTNGYSFDIGDGGTATGTFTMNGGTTTVKGETWIGSNSGTSTGNFNMNGGAFTGGDWFAVGRNGSLGTLTMTGGTITRQGGGGDNYVSEGAQQNSAINLSGGSIAINSGQFWLGNAGSSKGTLNVSNTGSFQVTNNWLAVGRNGTATGILNLSGGSVTKTGTYDLTLATAQGSALTIASGGTSVGTVNQTGGTLNSDATFIGETGTGTYNISAGTANLNNYAVVGVAGTGTAFGRGALNISGTANVVTPKLIIGGAGVNAAGIAPTIATGTVSLNGGTLTTASIVGGSSTAANSKVLNFNGGKLKASASSASFVSGLTSANVQANGALIDTNTFDATIGQALIHDPALVAADGGLAKSGLGTLTLTAANTYNGTTSITGGVLRANSTAYNSNLLANSAGINLGNAGGELVLDYSAVGTSPAATVKSILTAGYPNFTVGQIRSSTLANGRTIGYGDDTTNSLVSVRVTLPGDADLNGTVDFNDFLALQANFGQTGTRFDQGNFNYDNVTDFNDFLALQANFGQTTGFGPVVVTAQQIAAMTAFASAVPEPASIAVIAGVAAALGSRRRRSA